MRILISNDDGGSAPGTAAQLLALVELPRCALISPSLGWRGRVSALAFGRLEALH